MHLIFPSSNFKLLHRLHVLLKKHQYLYMAWRTKCILPHPGIHCPQVKISEALSLHCWDFISAGTDSMHISTWVELHSITCIFHFCCFLYLYGLYTHFSLRKNFPTSIVFYYACSHFLMKIKLLNIIFLILCPTKFDLFVKELFSIQIDL